MARTSDATVVVLEDHQDTCDLYVDALDAAGFHALAPSPSTDTVYLVQTLKGRVAVIVDIGVNGAGYDLAVRLATLTPRPRLLAVTGRHPGDLPSARLFDAYLMKPCLPDRLVAAVTDALAARAGRVA